MVKEMSLPFSNENAFLKLQDMRFFVSMNKTELKFSNVLSK